MRKFRPYHSPLKRLWTKLGDLGIFISNTYYKFNKFDDYHDSAGADPRNESRVPEFFGAFHPFFSMTKDVADTFKPYKSGFYVWRDILQPLRGLGNIIKGAAYLIVTPLLFLLDIVRASYYGIATNLSLSDFTSLLGLNFVHLFAGLFDGLNNIVRGALQIATAPLVLPRILLRAAITVFTGTPIFEATQRENVEKLEALVGKENKTLEDTIEIDYQLERLGKKIDKAEKRGASFFVNKDKLKAQLGDGIKFTDCKINLRGFLLEPEYNPKNNDTDEIKNALQFLGLFAENSPKKQGTDDSKQYIPFAMRD